MSETKKRTRPTAAQVKVLEDSLASLYDVIRKKDEMINRLTEENENLRYEVNRLMDRNLIERILNR